MGLGVSLSMKLVGGRLQDSGKNVFIDMLASQEREK